MSEHEGEVCKALEGKGEISPLTEQVDDEDDVLDMVNDCVATEVSFGVVDTTTIH